MANKLLDQAIEQLNKWYYSKYESYFKKHINRPSIPAKELADLLERVTNEIAEMTTKDLTSIHPYMIYYFDEAKLVIESIRRFEKYGFNSYYHIKNGSDDWYEIEKTLWVLLQYKFMKEKEK